LKFNFISIFNERGGDVNTPYLTHREESKQESVLDQGPVTLELASEITIKIQKLSALQGGKGTLPVPNTTTFLLVELQYKRKHS